MPLSEAHDSGLCSASPATKARFARDVLNLTLASPPVNRYEKGAKDAAEWQPRRNACWFVNRTLEVRRKYGLNIDRLGRRCPGPDHTVEGLKDSRGQAARGPHYHDFVRCLDHSRKPSEESMPEFLLCSSNPYVATPSEVLLVVRLLAEGRGKYITKRRRGQLPEKTQ